MDRCNTSKNKEHTVQELFNIYKDDICPYCVNKDNNNCEIQINGNITVICENYQRLKRTKEEQFYLINKF